MGLGRGAGVAHRIVAYTRDEKYVRFPMVPLLNTPLEYRGLQQLTTYYGKLGGGNSVFQYDLLRTFRRPDLKQAGKPAVFMEH